MSTPQNTGTAEHGGLIHRYLEHWELFTYGGLGVVIAIAAMLGVDLKEATLNKFTLMILALLLVTLGLAIDRIRSASSMLSNLTCALRYEQANNSQLSTSLTKIANTISRIERLEASDVLQDISPHEEIAKILQSGQSFVLVAETLFNFLHSSEALVLDAVARGCDFTLVLANPDHLPKGSRESKRASDSVTLLRTILTKIDNSSSESGSVRLIYPPSRPMCSALAVDYLSPTGLIRVQPFLLFPDSNPVKRAHFDLSAENSRSSWYAHYRDQVTKLIDAGHVVVCSRPKRTQV